MVLLPVKNVYLDPRPKDDLKSLYDRKEEVSKLASHIAEKTPLILITGFRRVGKTSLLKAVVKKHSEYNIMIDLRNLGSKSYVTKKDIVNLFQSSIQSFLDSHQTKKQKITSLLRSVRGITLPTGGGIQFDFSSNNELDLPGLFQKLDQWAGNNSTKIVIAVDEAQEFRKSRHIDMANIFASVYDNCRNIILILTGSEIGVLYDFLALENADSPLFGRVKKEIEINPLSSEQGLEFLKIGLKQKKIKIVDESVLSHAVEELGGIIGWLNEFGLTCVENKKVEKKFIVETKKTGSVLARSEFKKFLKGRPASERYNQIMKNLSIKPLSWTDLKKALELDMNESIDGRNFSSLLETLQKSGFIQELKKFYSIVDPLLKFSFERK